MKQLWKKRWMNGLWLLLIGSTIFIMVVATTKKDNKQCKGITVETVGDDHFFVTEKEVVQLLNANGSIQGSAIAGIKVNMLEKRLENDKWIKNAELYVDNNQQLQVVIEENEPVARIFTVGGQSYYIDSSCTRLPLNNKVSVRVPMITNFPSDRMRWSNADSALMADIKNMMVYINNHSFWKAQVAQVHINNNRELELVPTIGSHVVLFGKPTDVDAKFNRLYSFYKQVWVNIGLEKYTTLNVRYRGQVVATKKGNDIVARPDSSLISRQ